MRDKDSVFSDGKLVFYNVPSDNVSYFEHKMNIVDTFLNHSNLIWARTKRFSANAIECGLAVASIIESLPQFKPEFLTPDSDRTKTLYLGDLQGRWRVYGNPNADPNWFRVYTDTQTDASTQSCGEIVNGRRPTPLVEGSVEIEAIKLLEKMFDKLKSEVRDEVRTN